MRDSNCSGDFFGGDGNASKSQGGVMRVNGNGGDMNGRDRSGSKERRWLGW